VSAPVIKTAVMLVSPHAFEMIVQTFALTTAPADYEGAGWSASGLLMSNAKLFHYVFSVALMVLEYL
jgi:hypothetical protein